MEETLIIRKERYEDKVMRYLRENNYKIFMIDEVLEYCEIPKYKRIYMIGAIKKLIYDGKIQKLEEIRMDGIRKKSKYVDSRYMYIGEM